MDRRREVSIIPNSAILPHLTVKVKRPGERRSLSRTATRALDVMEVFGIERCALRAVDICKALSVTPSSVNQLLKTMVDSGHIVFDARAKTYLPSPRLAKFAGWMAELHGPDGRLGDVIRAISDKLEMVVTISAPNDLFMQVIDSAIPDGQTAERGLKVSLFGSAIGSAYLSTLDDPEIERLAQRARFPSGGRAVITDDVAHVRAVGFSEGPSIDSRIWSIAMPLPAHGQAAIPMVLGTAGEPDDVRARVSQIVATMREAIRQLDVSPVP